MFLWGCSSHVLYGTNVRNPLAKESPISRQGTVLQGAGLSQLVEGSWVAVASSVPYKTGALEAQHDVVSTMKGEREPGKGIASQGGTL